MNADEVLERLQTLVNPENISGMARYGINTENALGISIPGVREIAKEIGKDHQLAQDLWSSRIHEARILASMIDDPKQVTEKQMESWVQDFNSWDLCDQVCSCLFVRTPFAHKKALEWGRRPEEFVKRAGFALMAWLAIHDRRASDAQFEIFFPLMVQEGSDPRNFVKKAVNWALRQIGKRNLHLNKRAVETARILQQSSSSSARWIANDALRELTSDKIQARVLKKEMGA